MSPGIITLLTVISALVELRAEYLGPDWQVYVFKPLTMVFILLLAIRAQNPTDAQYRRLIIAGLGVSLLGDVLLMLPTDLFLVGLIVFLLAQIIYVVAFWLSSPRQRGPGWAPLPYVFYGVIVFSLLLPGLEDMLIPVLVYVVVISMMGWLALRRWCMQRQTPALLAAAGAAAFIFSDSALAVNRFLQPFAASSAVVLITYYIAQWLLARSVDADVSNV